MKQKRLAWANKYRSWTTDDWKNVAFSDEPARAEHLQQTSKYLPKNVSVFFTAGGPESLVPVDSMMNSSKYIKILKSRV
jgi:hypothetical protein